MSNNVNQSKPYRVYLKSDKKWVEVTEEYYREHIRYWGAFRKKAQYHDQCVCPKNKFWLCDGDCYNCEFHRAGDMLSLDYENKNEDGDSVSLLDMIPDTAPPIDEVVCDNDAHKEMLARLAELMPDAKKIGSLRTAEMSIETIVSLRDVLSDDEINRLYVVGLSDETKTCLHKAGLTDEAIYYLRLAELAEDTITYLSDVGLSDDEISHLRLKKLSDGAIADIIGVNRTTFCSRLSKAKAVLVKEHRWYL